MIECVDVGLTLELELDVILIVHYVLCVDWFFSSATNCSMIRVLSVKAKSMNEDIQI